MREIKVLEVVKSFKIQTQKYMTDVEFIFQRLGDAHAKHWSKYAFSNFSHYLTTCSKTVSGSSKNTYLNNLEILFKFKFYYSV